MADQTKKNKPITIPANKVLRAQLRRLRRTGIYGNKDSDTCYKLIQDAIATLIDSGRLDKLEPYAKTTLETDKPEQEEEESETEG